MTDEILAEMFREVANARPEILPSRFWIEHNNRHAAQLEAQGYANFKRTLALNYFTFVTGFREPQITHLLKQSPVHKLPQIALRTLLSGKHEHFTWKGSLNYNLLTHLLWEYVSSGTARDLIDKVSEPEEGNPPRIFRRGRLISQDLANSVLEFKSIRPPAVEQANIQRVMELGAGYGRTAYVFQSLLPGIKYMIADIPPALYVSQRYLTSQFPQKKVFKFRAFHSYDEVADELQNADIAFLLPHQLELLPDKSVDLFINISSLHEMRLDQIVFYFGLIERLTSQYFYFKQWKVSQNAMDNLTITEGDYPIPDRWTQIYWRECAVQTRFFEALFAV